jgi:hypothetical protein
MGITNVEPGGFNLSVMAASPKSGRDECSFDLVTYQPPLLFASGENCRLEKGYLD